MTRSTSRRAERQLRAKRRRQLGTAGIVAMIVMLIAGVVQMVSGVGATPISVGVYTGKETPTIPLEADWRSVELGLRFQVAIPGSVVAIRFFKNERNTGPHTGHLWDANGTLLATVNFTSESSSGFQVADLAQPVLLKPKTDYVVSYWSRLGLYSEDIGTFSTGQPIGNSVIWGKAGVYTYDTKAAFPASTWRGSSYYVDALFRRTPRTPLLVTPTPQPPTPSAQPTTPTPTATATPVSTTPSPQPTLAPTAVPIPPTPAGPVDTSAPSAASTGVPAGVKLTSVPGQITSGTGWRWVGWGLQVTQANVALNGLDINGPVSNTFAGLTVTNSRIRCTGEKDWCLSLGNNSEVSHVEIGGGADGTTFVSAIGVWTGGSGAGNALTAINIHHTTDGMRVDGGTTLADSYIHDLSMGQIPGAHSDGIQSTGGGNVVIRHNKISSGNNCNVFLQWLSGNAAITSYSITGNTFVAANQGGEQTSYGVCAYSPEVSGVTVSSNTFSRGYQVAPLTAPGGSVLSHNLLADGTVLD